MSPSANSPSSFPGNVATPGDALRFVKAFHRALRAIRLYPAENVMVRTAVDALHGSGGALLDATGQCDLQCAGDFVFVNGTRSRLQLDTYAALSHIVARFRYTGIGGVLTKGKPTAAAWTVLCSALLEPGIGLSPEERRDAVTTTLERAGIRDFVIETAVDDGMGRIELTEQERARQTFMHSLTATRQLMQDVRMGRTPALRQAKRAVQGIVDQIMANDGSLIGMTTLRDFDEYTFVHSVNVCILAVALGRRIGLGKVELLDLGLAALMHDLGKSRVPLEILNKREKLTPEEFNVLQSHTWRGVLAMFALGDATAQAWRAMTVAYEHHLGVELTGYPRLTAPRELSLFSRIVSIVDGFDAATSTRVYQPNPWSPADVIRGMRENPRLGLDPLLVRAFTGLMGIYPIGTVVLTDTQEVGLVVSAPSGDAPSSRPHIRVLFDARGNPAYDPSPVDLTERTSDGIYRRTIVRVEDPDRYGIRPSDYLT